MQFVKIKMFLVGLAGILLLSAQQCRQDINPDHLYQQWFHFYEEDTDTTTVYRPAGYDFPPARGRKGIEFKSGGELIQYDIAPTDGNVAVPGTWSLNAKQQTVQIQLNDPAKRTYQLKIIQLDKNRLEVQNQ